jgi:hypothetical protein
VLVIILGIVIFICSVMVLGFTAIPSWRHANMIIEQTRRGEGTPDYYAIARMEKAIWGQSFHQPGNPNCRCGTCDNRQPIYGNKDLVRPPAGPRPDWHDWECGIRRSDPSDTSGITEDWYGN